jgi:peptidoglycan-associated lipoprotein
LLFFCILQSNMKHVISFSLAIYIFTLLSLGSCATSNKIKDGSTAMEYKKYALAISLFKKELETINGDDAKATIQYNLGKCYENLLDYQQALSYYGQSAASVKSAKAALGSANMLKQLMQYREAATQYEALINVPSIASEARTQAAVCRSLLIQMQNVPKNLDISALSEHSLNSDYGVSLYDDDFLVVTSDRVDATGGTNYEWTGRKFSDLFLMHKETGTTTRFDSVINTEKNEGTPVFAKDQSFMVFVRCEASGNETDDHCKLMITKRINGYWGEPSMLPFVNANADYRQPALFEGDSVLLFTAKSDEEANGYDIFYAEWDGNTFVEPSPMPSIINTKSDEAFPTSDADTLYYSSTLPNGYGGMDIYKTYLMKDGSWAKPFHLPYPYNTGADDFSFIPDRSPHSPNILSKGFFTSSRSNNGTDKIYTYRILKNVDTPDTPTPTKEEPKAQKNYDIYVALKVNTPTYVNGEPSQGLIGKKSLPFAWIAVRDSKGKEILKQKADKNGLFLNQISSGEEYTFYVSKDSFLNNSLVLNTRELKMETDQNSITINKEILLDKIYRGKEILLENIYYEYDKWDILDEAKPSLDRLVSMLHSNPQIKIELGSHTDCRGNEIYNEELSAKRAQSAIDYLVSKGVAVSRLTSKGYGELLPAVNCTCESCSEEEHQANRRTSFKIL